tara:strand:- start:113 stop:271 length:159 start_codon:yes stop_codon:yes gene_type:complete
VIVQGDLPTWLLEHDEVLRQDGWTFITLIRVTDCIDHYCRTGPLSSIIDLFL